MYLLPHRCIIDMTLISLSFPLCPSGFAFLLAMPDIKQILASEAAKAIMPVSKQVQNKKAIPPLSAWRVHCITPFAPIDAVDREADPSDYYQTTLEDGTKVFTEWTPKEETEITRRLLALGVKSVVWHRTTLGNYKERLASIPRNEEGTIIFNLLDGHESDGWPGVSMMRAIEEAGIPFTGASSWFYDMDTIKHKMKKALVDTKAATPGYVDLTELTVTHEEALQSISKLKMPVLVKPSPSSGSLGLTEDSVCYDVEKAWTLALKIREQFGGAYVEEFIKGTVTIIDGDSACTDAHIKDASSPSWSVVAQRPPFARTPSWNVSLTPNSLPNTNSCLLK